MKKIITLTMMLAVLITAASAATQPQIKNVFPQDENRQTDTIVTVEVRNNNSGTENYNVTAQLRLPNGTVRPDAFDKSKQGSLQGEESLDLVFQFDKNNFEQFGEYNFIVNESMDGGSDTLRYELVPRPVVDLNFENLDIDLGDGQSFQVVTLDIQDLDLDSGTPLFPEIVPGVVEIYNVSSSGNLSFYKSYELEEKNETEVLQAIVPESDFEEGTYEVLANFTILGGEKKNYTQKKQENMRVSNANNTMELAILFSVLGLAFFFVYTGQQFKTSDETGQMNSALLKWNKAFKMLFTMIGYVFAVAALFIGGEIARANQLYEGLSPTMNSLLSVGVVLFIFLVVMLVLWRVNNTLSTGTGLEDYEEPTG